MPRFFIHMAFDGSAYRGWQSQPGGHTIQQEMEHVLSTLLQQEIAVTGAGRTDAGVHASFYIAHFDMENRASHKSSADPQDPQFVFRLNRFLPADIVVYGIREVPGDLHARYSATHRTYHYHISTIKPLFTRAYALYLYGSLDLDEIEKCCGLLPETTDFTSFSKLHTDVKTHNCKVMAAEWKEVEKGFLFEIRADRFLRNMVRSLVGTLIDVGQGKLDLDGFRAIVEARDRSRAGQSAPAHGLFLVDVGYGEFLP
jgi:tRNA pseudouridine38-40 synthase